MSSSLLVHRAEETARPVEQEIPQRTVTSDGMMTIPQRRLLVSLINQKIVDEEEREEALQAMEGYSKEDASDAIKIHLSPQTV